MKRYYYKYNEEEMMRLREDLKKYAQVMHYVYQEETEGIRFVCQIKKNEESTKAVTVIFRHNISTRLTIQMGIVTWLETPLIDAFFPELDKPIYEVAPKPLVDRTETQIRHDCKILIKVRLGNYFLDRNEVK